MTRIVGDKLMKRGFEYEGLCLKIEELEHELTTAKSRIAQLEAAAVLGGDGEPITLNSEKWCDTLRGKRVFGKVSTIFSNVNDDAMVTLEVDRSVTPHPRKFVTHEPECFSSPESLEESQAQDGKEEA